MKRGDIVQLSGFDCYGEVLYVGKIIAVVHFGVYGIQYVPVDSYGDLEPCDEQLSNAIRNISRYNRNEGSSWLT